MLDISINKLFLKQRDNLGVILKDISFSIPPNNIFTIVGKNGSGKSTLIKSLTGLLDKRFYSLEGKALFNGLDILSLNQNELIELRREKIKYVFQDAVNSFDHLKKLGYYFDKLADDFDEAEELLNFFFLPEADVLFKMYPYEASGGMAQRISLVLALLTHPQIIILDEPTSGIDSPIASLVLLKLKEFASSADNSVLLVTQDLLFAKKISNKIAFLFDSTLTDLYSTAEFFDASNNEKLSIFLDSYTQIS